MTLADAWRVLARAAELRAEGRCGDELPELDAAIAALEQADEHDAARTLALITDPRTPEERAGVVAALRAELTAPVTDEPFEAAAVGEIRYRLHPIDVGFDLREQDMAIAIDVTDDPIRVSYPGPDGDRRVMAGPQHAVLSRLRELGFDFELQLREAR